MRQCLTPGALRVINASVRVTVATRLLRLEADAIRARLEGSGISAWLADEGIVAANPLLANAVGGIKVQVEPENEEHARTLLEAEAPRGGDGCLSCGTAMGDEEQTCSSCGWTFL